MKTFEKYTFDCPILYYDKTNNFVKFIKQTTEFDWSGNINWTRNVDEWNSSNTLKFKGISIMEFQFHTKRKGMAIRWIFNDILDIMKNHLEITTINI